MKTIKISCDFCGKPQNDFESPKYHYFDSSEIKINIKLLGGYVSENDHNAFPNMSLDLCGECTEKFKKLINEYLFKVK